MYLRKFCNFNILVCFCLYYYYLLYFLNLKYFLCYFIWGGKWSEYEKRIKLINILKKSRTYISNSPSVYLFRSFHFFFMDLITRLWAYKVDYYPAYYPVPNLFTILWIVLFMGIITFFKRKGFKNSLLDIFYNKFCLFLTNCIYYSMTSLVFGFNLLELRDEGSSYIWTQSLIPTLWYMYLQ